MTKEEALKLALEALENGTENMSFLQREKAITAIEKALAQPSQQPVAHDVIAGVLFDFMGWLTSRPKRIMLSSTDDASPAVDAIRDFAKMRSLSLDDAKVQDWQEALAQPQQSVECMCGICKLGLQRKPLTLGQKQRLWSSVGDKPTLKDRVNAYGLAIEAAHGIKE